MPRFTETIEIGGQAGPAVLPPTHGEAETPAPTPAGKPDMAIEAEEENAKNLDDKE